MWITSQSLSTGIRHVKEEHAWMYEFWGNSKHRHTSWESAKSYAEEMRLAKIAFLEKQISTLKRLKFD